MTRIDESSSRVKLRCLHADPEYARTIFTALLGRLSGPPPDAEPTLHVPRPRPPGGGPALALVDGKDGPGSFSDVESSCEKFLPN
ncbi:MAG: hypothetical protein ACK40L_04335 [Hydrogenophaga sp.]